MNNSKSVNVHQSDQECLGTGYLLHSLLKHPYIGQLSLLSAPEEEAAVLELNRDRDNDRGPNMEVDYYFEVEHDGPPTSGLRTAARMLLEHGTLKPWHIEGNAIMPKPLHYDDYMAWAIGFRLLGYNEKERLEAGIVSIAYPLRFFDKEDGRFPLAQLMMAMAGEPGSAFTFLRGAKIIDVRLPTSLTDRLLDPRWPHARIREYLQLDEAEPIIGTIVKPKTGLSPELFASCVVEAAMAGARFTKADENLHLTLEDVPLFVGATAKALEKAGFDLGKPGEPVQGKRFLFAPHITTEPARMMDFSHAAVEAGANALMFSPYYGGGFQKMGEIVESFDVPVYAHTAGMNFLSGSFTWGIDASVMYVLAARYGAAFMQLTAVEGYLKPDDTEKEHILAVLRREGVVGKQGMTLVVAGGLSPANIGLNMKRLGTEGRMFLAGTSVYSHPDGAGAGVKALLLACRAYQEEGLTGKVDLAAWAIRQGKAGDPLTRVFAEI
jgi:ribulose-bisphosphate carboxylase large chain